MRVAAGEPAAEVHRVEQQQADGVGGDLDGADEERVEEDVARQARRVQRDAVVEHAVDEPARDRTGARRPVSTGRNRSEPVGTSRNRAEQVGTGHNRE